MRPFDKSSTIRTRGYIIFHLKVASKIIVPCRSDTPLICSLDCVAIRTFCISASRSSLYSQYKTPLWCKAFDSCIDSIWFHDVNIQTYYSITHRRISSVDLTSKKYEGLPNTKLVFKTSYHWELFRLFLKGVKQTYMRVSTGQLLA